MNSNAILYIVLCFLLPVILLCFYLEKRARRIMVSFCGGVLACLFAYFLNTLFLNAFSVSASLYSVVCSPFAEELLKLIPILAIALIVNKGRRGSTANAYAVGIGFCMVENTYYLMSELSSASVVWIVFRSIGTGLMHGMSATILGLGIYTARKKSRRAVLLIPCVFLAAVAYHALFNFLIQGSVAGRIFGVLLPILTYIFIFVFVKKEDIQRIIAWAEDEKGQPR